MSHEGIRFVDRDHAAREREDNRPLARIAVTPEKVRVLLSEGKGLEIDWADGHKSAWSFAWLREACPCATCNELRGKEGRKPGQPKRKPTAVLPMYTPPPTPWAATPCSSTGKMATPPASIRGSICAACASAGSARLRLKRPQVRRTRACSRSSRQKD
jgi:hypothetical protein